MQANKHCRLASFFSLLRPRRQQQRDCLVIGLGNPGEEYASTRHNVGFMVLDRLAGSLGFAFTSLSNGQVLDLGLSGRSAVLAKPGTFVNRAGSYMAFLLKRFKVALDNTLVLHDDITLDLGQYKFRLGGGSLGHRGLISIIEQLGTEDFFRLRVGIGQPQRGQSRVNFVLSPFEADQLELCNDVIEKCSTAVRDFVTQGPVVAMNIHNKRPR